MLKEKKNNREIAHTIRVDYTTIMREIKRGLTVQRDTNLVDREVYCVETAERKYQENLRAKGPSLKIGNDHELAVNAKLKLSIFAERECNFSPVSTQAYTALLHNCTCRLEARQALIYQLAWGLTGENGKYNYSKAVHVYPPFFNITCSAKNCKIASALTFERAVKERLIPRNPTDDCIAPKVQKVEMKTLLPEHLKAYLDAASARNVLPMFYLELVSGLRKGELVALLWSDLDAEHKTISVSKQYVRNPSGEVMLFRPKTSNSVRKIYLPKETVDLLVEEHKKHIFNRYMFPSPVTGEMYHPDSVVKLHEKILKDANLDHIRFHDLRHTFATLALQNGVDVKTVSSMLGHYDAGFTLRIYTHATRQQQNRAAETMGNFMAQVM